MTVCRRCGRTLLNAASRRRGYGVACARIRGVTDGTGLRVRAGPLDVEKTKKRDDEGEQLEMFEEVEDGK